MVAGISLSERLKRHPAQNVAMLLLLMVGSLMFASEVFAQGNLTDSHLELNVKEGYESTAIWVGLGILLAVYALIITEVIHRTLAAALGGLVAVLALNYYTVESTLTLRAVTTMIDWETIGLLLGMMVMVGILSRTGIF